METKAIKTCLVFLNPTLEIFYDPNYSLYVAIEQFTKNNSTCTLGPERYMSANQGGGNKKDPNSSKVIS